MSKGGKLSILRTGYMTVSKLIVILDKSCGNLWLHPQDLLGCSLSACFARSTAGGITSPMPVHTRSVTASS